MLRILTVIYIFTVLIVTEAEKSHRKLLLSVYYESNSPSSKAFILKQLRPAVELLHQYLKLQFVPFGKSQSLDYGFRGFDCENGPGECIGNMMQDCALNLMKNMSDRKKLSYVTCEMQTEAGSMGSLECVLKSSLPLDSVQYCMSHDKGVLLQLDSEYKTSVVNSSVIPAITIDGNFDQAIQESAMVDLFGTLCSLLMETPPCANYYNRMALNYVLYPAPLNLYKVPSIRRYPRTGR